jgi:hypothetical protein
MRALLIAPYYIQWHYGKALTGIIEITSNLAWFMWHFFSVGLLFQTLFSPWQRLQEKRKRGLDIEGFLSTILINIVMRLVGALIRLIFIIMGVVGSMLVLLGGTVVLAVWFILPLAVVVCAGFGFIFMFKAS